MSPCHSTTKEPGTRFVGFHGRSRTLVQARTLKRITIACALSPTDKDQVDLGKPVWR
jgi:hypothetical protein